MGKRYYMVAEVLEMPEITNFYKQRIAEHGVGYKAMWGDEESNRWKAFERFKIIEQDDLQASDMLLDLGCGIGLLCEYLDKIKAKINYTGVDIVPEFLEQIEKNKYGKTIKANFFADFDNLPQSDWLAIFGSINKKWLLGLEENNDVSGVYDWLKRCFERSRKGLFLSCFSSRADTPKPANVHLDPVKLLDIFGSSLKSYRIRHDTQFYEFTMMASK